MKIKLIIIMCVIVLIVGCYGSGSNGSSRSNAYYDENYHEGYDGIDMRFIPGNPPSTIYAPNGNLMDSYYIMVELKNEGAFTPTQNHFIISGYDSGIFDIAESYFQVPKPMEGRSSANPRGAYETVTWTVQRTNLPEGIDRFPQSFMVSACYDYRTTASIRVCVDPKPWEYTSREKICRPEDVSVSGGQGAPVAITNVEVTPMNNKVQMKLEISNVGNGRVVSNDIPLGQINSKCPFNLNYEDLNKVTLITPDVGGVIGSCTPSDIILVNGRANVYCTFDGINKNGRDDAYLTTLNINLVYKYTSSIQYNVDVIAVPG